MRKHKDFMSEPDYGYIDIEACFEPVFEPPLETLEEWRRWEDEPEPTGEHLGLCHRAGWRSIFLLRQYQDSGIRAFLPGRQTHGQAN